MSAQDGTEPVSPAEGRHRWLVAMLNEGGLEVCSGDETGDSSAHRDSGSSPSPRGLSGLRGRLRRRCVITVVEVGVDGAGVTMMSSADAALAGYRDQLAATGPLTRRREDLQLTLGEGPCVDAYTSGAPVLAGDVATGATRWLGFAPEAIAADLTSIVRPAL